ncbi:MAG: NADH-quinone oxidoreductase subunit [Bacteroidetes bacterium]|jgi:NADH-quinone oxidoreductase subunit M|nr:NADH-quinone oxidoreductase subunit [Bacteroidota bacterium]
MLTGLLIVIPLIAALLTFFIKGKAARVAALGFSILEFAVSVFAWYQYKTEPLSKQLYLNCTWIESIGANFSVGLDGMSLLMVLLTTFLVPLIILSSFKNEYDKPNSFYGLILLMQMALIGVFTTNDGFLFYIFWELALIPIYFICLVWGGENRARITFKFFIYTLFGSLFMLVALVFLYQHTGMYTGIKSWAINDLYQAGRSLNASQQGYVFWAVFLAFAIKMPIFPFHTWQPDTYVNAPTQGTMLLSGIMLKMGTFGMIKWLLPVVPLGVANWGSWAMLLSVIGIIYASCIAIVQTDFKRLIAYSSIAHVGLIAAGILAWNQQGIQGALIQMVSHGINVVGLFLVADILFRHTGTREISKLGGIRNVNPWFAVLFLIILLGSVALPLTNGFVGEFLLITGVYGYGAWTAAFAGLTVILGAVYMLRSYQGIMLGESNSVTAGFGTLAPSDKAVLIIVCAAIIAFGVYPQPLTDLAEPAVKNILSSTK